MQGPTVDNKWRTIVRSERGDGCTHLGEWFDNSAHRPLGERIVTNKPGGEGLPGENSGKQTHCRPGVAAIDVAFGGDEFSVGPVNNNKSRVRTLDGDTELLERPYCAKTILSFQEIRDLANAVGKRRKHDGSMRYALIPGHDDFGLQSWSSSDAQYIRAHDKSWRIARARSRNNSNSAELA